MPGPLSALEAPAVRRPRYDRPMPRPRRLLLILALMPMLLGLAGCTEAEETWTFDRKGGGEYALVVRWNADLWRRVRGVLGSKVMARLAGDGFPLRAELWRDGLRDLEGVEILELEARDTDTGMRELRLRARFQKVEQILRWDVLAGRTVRIEPPSKEDGGPARTTFYMEPIPRVPVLDQVAALVEAAENPPPAPEGAAAARDPLPLERFGIEPSAGAMVWRMVKLPLGEVRLRTRVIAPAPLASVRGRPVLDETTQADFQWTFADLRRSDADRTVRLRWDPREFDEGQALDHRGQRDPRARAPDGSRK